MMQVVRKTFRDRRLVRILERWVRMLPEGVSIGMRPSQGLENLLLSIFLDHVLKDKYAVRHFHRYCDDKVTAATDSKELTKAIRIIRDQTEAAELDVKDNAQVWDWEQRPVDFLGYIVRHDGKVSVRKHIKQRFARRWCRIRSRRRRRELIGSFYGVAKHAHANHLFRKITGLSMTTFAELGFVYQRDGKKEFAAEPIRLSRLVNKAVVVKDFETDIRTREGDGRYLVLIEHDGHDYKFFTNSQQMKAALDYALERSAMPFECVIESIGGNAGYMFK